MDLCLMFAALIAVMALRFALLFAYCWWADTDPLLMGDDPMEADLKALIVDLEAHSWLKAVVDGSKLASDIVATFGGLSQSRALVRSLPKGVGPDGSVDSLLSTLNVEAAATAIDWAKILQIVIAVIQAVAPLILA